jgi:LysR family glycine cleavage system transcriptional activator
MARRLPPLNALKAFEAAARLSSFSRAAAELNVTHAAISRHVRGLEAEFRTRLFERTGRGVELTEAGQSLALELTAGFDLIATAASRFARPSRRRQRLIVSADVSFAALWLAPRLGGFTSRNPGIDLVVDASHRLVDFGKEDVDLGIRFGAGVWRGVEAAKLIDAELTLVCSPALWRSNPVGSPAELKGELLIRENAKESWQPWLGAAGVAGSVVPSGPTLNGDLAIAAAETGQGFAIADQIQSGHAVLEGRLICPFDIVAHRLAYYVVRGAGTKPSKAAADFEAWLRAELDDCVIDFTVAKSAPPDAPVSGRTSRRPQRRRTNQRPAAAPSGTKRTRKPPMA